MRASWLGLWEVAAGNTVTAGLGHAVSLTSERLSSHPELRGLIVSIRTYSKLISRPAPLFQVVNGPPLGHYLCGADATGLAMKEYCRVDVSRVGFQL